MQTLKKSFKISYTKLKTFIIYLLLFYLQNTTRNSYNLRSILLIFHIHIRFRNFPILLVKIFVVNFLNLNEMMKTANLDFIFKFILIPPF